MLAVLAYHLGLRHSTGGFVGVDIFFVISGYLITSSITTDMRRDDFSFIQFYERRIRRIFPALFCMTFILSVILAIYLPPTNFDAFGKSLAAMASFVSNFYFGNVTGAASYFAVKPDQQFLLHTWSLSVEEQFYIVLPVFLLSIKNRSVQVKFLSMIAVCGCSLIFSELALHAHPNNAFYSPLSRTWELMLGAILSAAPPPGRWPRLLNEAMAAIGLLMLAAAIGWFDDNIPFPGLYALVPCFGTFLLIGTGALGTNVVSRLLSSAPFVVVGRLSYSLYLWHWPIIACVAYLRDDRPLDNRETFAVAALSFAAAYVSWRWVERPFRTRSPTSAPLRTIVAGVSSSLVLGLVGYIIDRDGGISRRFDAQTAAVILANEERKAETSDSACSTWHKDVRTIGDLSLCAVGPVTGKHLLVWGDSHAEYLRDVIGDLNHDGQLRDPGLLMAIALGCRPALTISRTNPAYHCAAYSRLALQRALGDDIDIVFIDFLSGFGDGAYCKSSQDDCKSSLGHTAIEDLFIADLKHTLSELKRHGKTPIISLPTPYYTKHIPDFEIKHAALGRLGDLFGFGQNPSYEYNGIMRQKLIDLAAEENIAVYDETEDLCPNGKCIFEKNGVSVYMDDNHVSSSGTHMFRDELRRLLGPQSQPTASVSGPLRPN